MIHLRAEHWSSLGDDTFWCWAEREFPGAVKSGKVPVEYEDTVLHYGLLGAPARHRQQTVALLWEQHPEMVREIPGNFARETKLLRAAAAQCARRTVATPLLVDDYREFGQVDVLPIGVDTELWRPARTNAERQELRAANDIPTDATVGFWGGHGHHMKGYDLFKKYASEHPHVWWVVAFKRYRDRRPHGFRGLTLAGVPQTQLAVAMRMCDFALFTSRLRPYAMLEWEAMATNLRVVNVGHPHREFKPPRNPRHRVLDLGWDRHTARATWLEYLDQ